MGFVFFPIFLHPVRNDRDGQTEICGVLKMRSESGPLVHSMVALSFWIMYDYTSRAGSDMNVFRQGRGDPQRTNTPPKDLNLSSIYKTEIPDLDSNK